MFNNVTDNDEQFLDPVHTVPDRQGHDIKLNTFKTRVALTFTVILQNLTSTNQRKSGKSKNDCKLTKLDVVITQISYHVNGVLMLKAHRDLLRVLFSHSEN